MEDAEDEDEAELDDELEGDEELDTEEEAEDDDEPFEPPPPQAGRTAAQASIAAMKAGATRPSRLRIACEEGGAALDGKWGLVASRRARSRISDDLQHSGGTAPLREQQRVLSNTRTEHAEAVAGGRLDTSPPTGSTPSAVAAGTEVTA